MENKLFKKIIKIFLPYVICTLFAILAGFALLHPGLPPTHDGEYHVVRFYEFFRMIQAGFFYPRWAPDLYFGYGVPLFNYVYPLPNYFATFFHMFGASFIDGFKLNMFSAGIVGSIFMYSWSKRYWGMYGGIVSSTLFSFAPYHLVDVYIRGSVGEVWAMALFPGFLWAIDRLSIEKNRFNLVLPSILLSLIIFSHNILALMFFPFAISYVLIISFLKKDYSFLLSAGFVFLFGLGVSSIFWLPALFETKYVVGLQVFDLSRNFPDLYQLLIPAWGSGIFGLNIADEMSVQIGVVNLFVIFGSLVGLAILIKRKEKNSIILLFSMFWFFTVFFLMLSYSRFVWDRILLMQYFQFPWRFLSLEILICAFLGGFLASIGKKKLNAIVIISLSIFLSINYIGPAHYLYRNDDYYTSRSNFIDSTNSPGNAFNTKWASGITQRASKKFDFSTNIYNLSMISRPGLIEATGKFDKNTHVVANILYFPGWNAFANGKRLVIRPDNQGKTIFEVPSKTTKITLKLTQTTIEFYSEILSMLSVLVLLTLLIKSWYSIKYAHRT